MQEPEIVVKAYKLREEDGYLGPLVSSDKSTGRWLAQWTPWLSATAVSSGVPHGHARAEIISSGTEH